MPFIKLYNSVQKKDTYYHYYYFYSPSASSLVTSFLAIAKPHWNSYGQYVKHSLVLADVIKCPVILNWPSWYSHLISPIWLPVIHSKFTKLHPPHARRCPSAWGYKWREKPHFHLPGTPVWREKSVNTLLVPNGVETGIRGNQFSWMS